MRRDRIDTLSLLVALAAGVSPTLYFQDEGRLFFDNFSDISHNYMFWGGIRYVFPPNR